MFRYRGWVPRVKIFLQSVESSGPTMHVPEKLMSVALRRGRDVEEVRGGSDTCLRVISEDGGERV